jgi:hypothetical protein
MTATEVLAALEPARRGLQADGADLDVEAVQDGIAHVRLLLSSQTCAECVVPAPLLSQILQAAVEDKGLEVRIELIDPRQAQ